MCVVVGFFSDSCSENSVRQCNALEYMLPPFSSEFEPDVFEYYCGYNTDIVLFTVYKMFSLTELQKKNSMSSAIAKICDDTLRIIKDQMQRFLYGEVNFSTCVFNINKSI